MKRLRFILSILLLIFLNFVIVLGQQKRPDVPNPPDGVWLYDNLFIDKTEVANVHWLEFLFFLSDSSESLRNKCLVDSTVWNQFPGFEDSNSNFSNYLRYPPFRFYPVVGITYEQAQLYCKWRSKMVTKVMNLENNEFKIKVTYRLPTEKEWEFAAQGKLNIFEYPYGYKELKGKPIEVADWKKYWNIGKKYWVHNQFEKLNLEKKKIKKAFKEYSKSKQLQINCKSEDPKILINDLKATSSMKSGKPNSLGIYCMIGNVAELIQEKGIVKGGSWFHSMDECRINNKIKVAKSNAWVGFRCIAEVEINKK